MREWEERGKEKEGLLKRILSDWREGHMRRGIGGKLNEI